ncbi:MAG: M13 family metallopeptidase N-terminal domain-containing protein, partial [Thermoanaerobaculia bacterium]|nr:M13 family metallopeptidase N-terminal domain-containing protein [Thermoanaerobaculia bacterium]
MTRKLMLIGMTVVMLAGCAGTTGTVEEAKPAAPIEDAEPAEMAEPAEVAEAAEIGAWGVDLSARDTSVDPGNDFNEYANGAWMDEYEIPPDLSRYGAFIQLRLDAESDVREIVEELAAKEAPKGTLEQKVGDFYESWMDVETLDRLGAEPLRPHLERIDAIEDHEGVTREFASLHNTAPFGIGIIPDPADTTRYIAFVGQSGLGMPNRDYYLEDDERFVEYREAYRDYITTILGLAGIESSDEKADRIIELETRLAEVHWTPEDSRDIQKIYNPMSPEQVAELAPEIDWNLVFHELDLEDIDTFVVAQTTAIDDAAEIFANAPVDLWKEYLAFHFIRRHAQYLSTAFDDAHYEFYSKTLRGTEEQRERWKRGVQLINANLGEA